MHLFGIKALWDLSELYLFTSNSPPHNLDDAKSLVIHVCMHVHIIFFGSVSFDLQFRNLHSADCFKALFFSWVVWGATILKFQLYFHYIDRKCLKISTMFNDHSTMYFQTMLFKIFFLLLNSIKRSFYYVYPNYVIYDFFLLLNSIKQPIIPLCTLMLAIHMLVIHNFGLLVIFGSL